MSTRFVIRSAKRLLLSAIGFLSTCVYATVAAPNLPPVGVRDIVEFVRLTTPDERQMLGSEPVFDVAPDGRHVVMVSRRGNVATNRNDYTLQIYRIDDVRQFVNGDDSLPLPKPRSLLQFSSSSLYVFEHAIRDVKWLPDSRHVTFLGEENDELTQVYKLDIETGERTQLTRSPHAVLSYEHHRASGTTMYVFRVPLGIEGSEGASFPAEVNTVNQLMFPHFPENFELEYQIALADLTSSQGYRTMGEPFAGHMPPAIAISPSALYAVSHELIVDPRENQRWFEIFPIFKNDSSLVDILTTYDPYFLKPRNGFLWQVAIYKLKTGQRHLIDAPDGRLVAGYATGLHWLSDSRIVLANTFVPVNDRVVNGTVRDRSGQVLPVVAEYDLNSRSWSIIQRLEAALIERNRLHRFVGTEVTAKGAVKVSTNSGSMYYERMDTGWRAVGQSKEQRRAVLGSRLQFTIEQAINSRPDVYAYDPKTDRKRRLTNLNPQFDSLDSARAELFSWRDAEGRPYESQLIFPVTYDPGRRYPLLIQTYGSGSNEFVLDGGDGTTSAAAVRAIAGQGIMVLILPNLPTYQTYQEFIDYRAAIRGAVEALEAKGLIDPARVGITGFSAMGKIVRDIITFSDVSIAAATISDAWNPSLFGYIVYNFGFFGNGALANEIMWDAQPWGEGLKTWVERDPMLHTDRITAALRIEHYGNYVPPHFDAYVLMRRQHKPVELVWFPPPTAHQLRRPDQRMDSLQGNVDWFRFWLKDEEDSDPAKAEQYRRWREMRDLN